MRMKVLLLLHLWTRVLQVAVAFNNDELVGTGGIQAKEFSKSVIYSRGQFKSIIGNSSQDRAYLLNDDSSSTLFSKLEHLESKAIKVWPNFQDYASHPTIHETDKDKTVKVKTLPGKDLQRIIGHLTSDHFLGKDHQGRPLLVTFHEVSNLTVLNEWTRSPIGCACSYPDSEPNCACCEARGCHCNRKQTACSKCDGNMDHDSCSKDLVMNVSASFSFGEGSFSSFVFIGSGRLLKFYIYDEDRKQLKQTKDLNGAKEITLTNEISSLSYQELLTYDGRILHNRRFLFVFTLLGATNVCYEIDLGPNSSFVLRTLHSWSRKGGEFHVWNWIGHFFIGYSFDGKLKIDGGKITKDLQLYKLQSFDFEMKSWQFFKSRENFFLVLENGSLMKIMVFIDDKFVEHQPPIFVSEKIDEIVIINDPSREDRAVLFVLSGNFKISYVEESGTFLKKEKELLKTTYTSRNVRFHDNIHSVRTSYLFLVSSDGRELLILLFSGNKYFGRDSFTEKSERIHHILDKYKRAIKYLEEIEIKLSHALGNAKRSESKLVIKEWATFEQSVTAHKLLGSVSEDTFGSFHLALDSITRNFQTTEISLDHSKNYLKDVVPKTGSIKTISGVKHFYGPKTVIKNFFVKDAIIGDIFKNEESLDSVLQNLVRIDDERQIKGRKIFHGKINVRDLRTSTLNRKDSNTFVTTMEPVEFEGAAYTEGISVAHNILLNPKSLVGGKDLSEEIIRLVGNYELGSCHFSNLTTKIGLDISKDIVNSDNLRNFLKSILTVEQSISLAGSIPFSSLIIKGNLNTLSVNNLNTEKVFDLVTKSRNDTLKNVLFESSVNFEDVIVKTKIGNDKFPDDLVVRSTSTNFESKTLSKANFRDLTVGGYVDHRKTLDLVTKSTPQEIEGIKTFSKDIKVFGDLNIQSPFIDNVDIQLLFKKPDTNELNKIIVFEENVTSLGVLLYGKVNNLSISEVSDDLVYKDDNEYVITGRKVFIGNLKVEGSSRTKFINKKNIDDFVNVKKSKLIPLKKKFTNAIFEDLNVQGLVSKTNMSDLFKKAVYLNKPYPTITGMKYFNTLFTNRLKVEKLLSNKRFDKLMTESSDQLNLNILSVDDAYFNILKARSVELDPHGLVNGIHMSAMTKRLNAESVADDVAVHGNVFLNDLNVDIINKKKNNMNNILVITKDEQIFENDVEFNILQAKIVETTNVSGNSQAFKESVSGVHLHSKNLFHNVKWENIKAETINVRNKVNNMNLREESADSVYIDDPNTFSIKGTKHFSNGLEVNGDVDTNIINGRNLMMNLFSKTTTQNVSSPFTFNDLGIHNALLLTFNEFYMDLIKRVKRRGETVIDKSLRFDGFVNLSTLEIDGLFEDKYMADILKDAVQINGKKGVIGKKTFTSVPVISSIALDELNGNDNLRRKGILQKTLNNLFVNGTISTTLLTTNNLNTKNQRSILSPKYLGDEFVLSSEKVHYPLKFQSVRILGEFYANEVNNLNLGKLFTRSTNQIIQQPVTVSSISAEDLFVKGQIDGYKIIYGVNLNSNLKRIKGSLSNNSLNIYGDVRVKGKFGVNGLTIPEDLLLLGKDNTIRGSVSFAAPLTTTQVTSSDKSPNGIDLDVLKTYLKAFRKLFYESIQKDEKGASYVETMETIFLKECERTQYLQSLTRNVLVEPEALEFVSRQDFNDQRNVDLKYIEKSSFTPILIFQFASGTWLLNSLHFGACQTKVFKWSESSLKFKEAYVLEETGNIQQWVIVESTSESIHILGISSGTDACNSKGSTLYKATTTAFKLKKVQEVEAAISAIVDSPSFKVVYLDVGYEIFKYSFKNGILTDKELVTTPKIKIVKSITKSNESLVTVRVRDKGLLEIVEDFEKRIIYMPDIKQLTLATHLNNIILVISKTKRNLQRLFYVHEPFLYKDMSLLPMTPSAIKEHSSLRPICVDDDGSNSTFLFAYHDDESPKIFRIAGESIFQVWSGFSVTLGSATWAYDFSDSRNNCYVTFGDEEKMITLKLEKTGRKFEGENIRC